MEALSKKMNTRSRSINILQKELEKTMLGMQKDVHEIEKVIIETYPENELGTFCVFRKNLIDAIEDGRVPRSKVNEVFKKELILKELSLYDYSEGFVWGVGVSDHPLYHIAFILSKGEEQLRVGEKVVFDYPFAHGTRETLFEFHPFLKYVLKIVLKKSKIKN